jgi:hypothetical protein
MRKPAVAVVGTILFASSFLVMGTTPASSAPLPCIPGATKSNNIDCIGLVPNVGVIGARFRGHHMFVTSVTGLKVYDIEDPEDPTEVGSLALPHFENEDVDLGGDILLISNDAAESRGLLYIIDIDDPTNPQLIGAPMDMGGNPVFGGPGHTASCILGCKFAWITDGGSIRVVDLRDPENPETVGSFQSPVGGLAMHDVQVDGNGLAWVAGFDGTAAYKLPKDYASDPLKPVLVTQTNEKGQSTYDEEFGLGDGDNYNDFIHHNSFRREDDSVVFITEEDYTRPTCAGAGSFQTWRLPMRNKKPTGGRLTPIDKWQTELLSESPTPTAENPAAAMCSAHYFDLRANMVAQGWYEQGTRFLDVSNPEKIRQIGYYFHTDSMTWASYFAPTDRGRDTVYVLDATSGIEILHIDRPNKGPLSAPHVGCNGSQTCLENNKVNRRTASIDPDWNSQPAIGFEDSRFGYACRLTLSDTEFP